MAAGDLNADGSPDVVQTCVYGGTDTVGVLLNRGTANGVWQGLAAPVAYDTGSGNPTTPAVVADLDGDGTADVAVGTSAGTVSVLAGVGDGTLRAAAVAATVPTPGVTPSSLAAADVNGDGRIDLVIGTGTANAVYVLRNLGWSATAWQGFDPGAALVAGSMVTGVAVTDAIGRHVSDSRLIDGGVWANNPAVVGIAEAVSTLGCKLDDIRVLSLGTTNAPTERQPSLDGGGFLQWLRRGDVIDVLMRGQGVGTTGLAGHLIGCEDVYRVDPVLPKALALDRANESELLAHAEHTAIHDGPEIARRFFDHRASAYTPHYPAPSEARP